MKKEALLPLFRSVRERLRRGVLCGLRLVSSLQTESSRLALQTAAFELWRGDDCAAQAPTGNRLNTGTDAGSAVGLCTVEDVGHCDLAIFLGSSLRSDI